MQNNETHNGLDLTEIVWLGIDDVHPYENNPRNNELAVADVAMSISKYGFKQPIVVDENHVIVVGHTRYEAATRLGYESVPCVISHLTDEQNREYRIVDNKTNEAAGWDFLKLEDELADLDFGDFGFDFSFGSENQYADNSDIDWDDGVDEISDENYEEPQKDMLCCPKCGHVDSKERFKKVSE